jgi:hypothetical protein
MKHPTGMVWLLADDDDLVTMLRQTGGERGHAVLSGSDLRREVLRDESYAHV